MRRIFATLALLFASTATAELGTPVGCILPGACGGSSLAIPGLSASGIGDYSTLEYLRNLRSFAALPNYPPIYFSADANTGCDAVRSGPNAGTCLPAGNDTTGNGTAELPYLTITKCEALSQFGRVHCIFDSADAWDVAGDHTGDNGFSITTNTCNTEEPCIVWSGSDRTGGDPAEFDCKGMFGDSGVLAQSGLFLNVSSTKTWAFENILLDNCPTDDQTENFDIFRTDQSANFVVLNVQLPHLQGPSNEYYTTHNASATNPQFVALNPFCHIIEHTNGASNPSCFRDGGNSDLIVIGGEMSSSDDAASTQESLFIGHSPATSGTSNTTLIGSTLRNLDAVSAGMFKVGLDLTFSNDTATINGGYLLNTIQGFRNIANEFPVWFGNAATTDDTQATMYFYKNSITGGSTGLRVQANNAASGFLKATLTCDAFDGQSARTMDFISDCANIEVDVFNNISDINTPTNAFVLEATAVESAANLITQSTTAGCLGAPWSVGITNQLTPFGSSSLELPYCRNAACAGACAVDGEWTFPNGGSIPAWAIGGSVPLKGFKFPAPSNVGR